MCVRGSYLETLQFPAIFVRPKRQNKKITTIQIVAGRVITTSLKRGRIPCADFANLLPLNHAQAAATAIAVPAITKLNQLYLPGSQKSALLATNNANKLSRNNSHFIACLRQHFSRSESMKVHDTKPSCNPSASNRNCRVYSVGRSLSGWVGRISATNSYLLFASAELHSLPLSSPESFDRMPAPSNVSKSLRQSFAYPQGDG